MVQKTTNEQSRLLNQIEKEKVNPQIVYGEKEFLEEMDKYPRVNIDDEIRQMLINMPKNERWEPSKYIQIEEIKIHLKLFEDGVVRVENKERFNRSLKKYKGYIGPVEGQFVMPKFVYEKAVKASNGNPRVLEKLLGFEQGFLGENPVVIESKQIHGLRFPSGREPGAYDGLWEPGGYTKGGIPEAIVNQFIPGEYTVKSVYERILN